MVMKVIFMYVWLHILVMLHSIDNQLPLGRVDSRALMEITGDIMWEFGSQRHRKVESFSLSGNHNVHYPWIPWLLWMIFHLYYKLTTQYKLLIKFSNKFNGLVVDWINGSWPLAQGNISSQFITYLLLLILSFNMFSWDPHLEIIFSNIFSEWVNVSKVCWNVELDHSLLWLVCLIFLPICPYGE